ncbi:PTS sugar transporter subunit IIA [Lysinibacter sp. HNR]|uniref:BglG family transcription antiterminator n=1 Tax=Lysinibacter sp. HNR TaxID=3031408 RepID=UPI002434A05B|nr:PTS sugar transporter subunit IIA [Lysinibacter sp. HNR]WGD36730.1 PTS sugar transporter subunit IIA [Lysinibacter sp. HNR]
MSIERAHKLVAYLAAAESWVTADELANSLGVTTRSVRNYAATVRELYAPFEVVEASSRGYRIARDDYQQFLKAHDASSAIEPQIAERPSDRQASLITRLLNERQPMDVHTIASEYFVSESTIEADLRRIRPALESSHLSLKRSGSDVSIMGTELDKRRVLASLYLKELTNNVIDLAHVQSHFATPPLGPLKTRVIELLQRDGLSANDFGLSSVLLSAAIAGARVRSGFLLPESASGYVVTPPPVVSPAVIEMAHTIFGAVAEPPESTGLSGSESSRSFLDRPQPNTPRSNELQAGVPLPGWPPCSETQHIAHLFEAQVVRRPGQAPEHLGSLLNSEADSGPLPASSSIRPQVAEIVHNASSHFTLDLSDDAFIDRLTEHVTHVIERAKGRLSSPNPMTQSLKESYPTVYEVAVFLADKIGRSFNATLDENEIAFLALHVGSHLERVSPRTKRLSCVFVCPDYYGMHLFLRNRIEQELHDVLEITSVITRTDVDWARIDADIVLSTIPVPPALPDVLHIQPFLTEEDKERIRYRASRIHRRDKRHELKKRLLRYLSPNLFTTELAAQDATEAIRALGNLLIKQGVVEESYVNDALERERMSSTAFGELIAVPHAMNMTAHRTAIAISVSKTAIPWGESRVQIVAFVAFSADDREDFQTVFDQLVKVFSARSETQQIIRSSDSFETFLEALSGVMGE